MNKDIHKNNKSVLRFLSLEEGKDSEFTCENIVVLLGAGASVEAGVPMLSQIMNTIEKHLNKELKDADTNVIDKKWTSEIEEKKFKSDLLQAQRETALFNYFKTKCPSADYSLNTSANIEDILALMNDVASMKEKSNLYHVVGEWEKELVEGSRDNFSFLKKFITKIQTIIKRELRDKLDEKKLGYFNFIFYLQRKFRDSEGVLNIFSLNHDMSIETAYGKYLDELKQNGASTEYLKPELETGFHDNYSTRTGEYKYVYSSKKIFKIENFEPDLEGKYKKHIHLYKLHGSINWKRIDKSHKIVLCNPKIKEKDSQAEIIFGVSQKYKSTEPYSSIYHEFKRKIRNKKVKLLVIVGYGFNDKHINDAITSAMESNDDLKLCVTNPVAAETYFFSHPKLLHERHEEQEAAIQNIVRTQDFEEYMNITDAMFSAYYSRNYDEDALFLACCVEQLRNEKDSVFIKQTKAFQIGENWLIDLFKNDIEKRGYGFSLDDVGRIFNQQNKRNEKLYNRLFAHDDDLEIRDKTVGYPDVTKQLKRISEMKTELYKVLLQVQQAKDVQDFEEIASFFKSSDNQPIIDARKISENKEIYKRCILELREDLRVIEKFIEVFIPVHIYLTFFYIKQYNTSKDEYDTLKKSKVTKSSLNNLSLTVLELFLKYNYFIEAIQIHLAGKNEKKSNTEDIEDYRKILGTDYTEAFQNVLKCRFGRGKATYGTECKLLNDFLAKINDYILPYREDHFNEEMFLTWKDDNPNPDYKDNFLLKSVLHKKTPEESDMQKRVQLYSKALCKSMIGRTEHKKRLLTDIVQLVRVGTQQNTMKLSEWEEKVVTEGAKTLNDKRNDKEEGKPEYPGSNLVLESNGEYYFNDFDEKFIRAELGRRINANTNSYLHYNYKNLYELLKLHYRLKFDKFETNEKFLEKLNDNFKEENLRNDDNKGDLKKWKENRIVFRHFKGKLFFTKEFRILNMFKYYNSTFYSDTYIDSFNNPDKAIADFLENEKQK